MMRGISNWTGYLPKSMSLITRARTRVSATVLSQTTVATLGASIAGTGVDWVNPNNALTANGLYADAVLNSVNTLSDYLRVTGFSFTVSGSIVGVEAALLRRNTGFPATGIITNASTRLVLDGVALAEKTPGSTYPATNTTELLGGSSDLWGTTFTPTQVNDPLFGVETLAQYVVGTADCTAQVDRLILTIYYIP